MIIKTYQKTVNVINQFEEKLTTLSDEDLKAKTSDFKQMIARKQGVVDQMTKGVEFLMKKNKVEAVNTVPNEIDFALSPNIEIKTNDK